MTRRFNDVFTRLEHGGYYGLLGFCRVMWGSHDGVQNSLPYLTYKYSRQGYLQDHMRLILSEEKVSNSAKFSQSFTVNYVPKGDVF